MCIRDRVKVSQRAYAEYTFKKALREQKPEISDDEILSRLHGALINEGTRILEEGHAFRASDIDVCYVNGYGFAAHRGGPMWQADKMGVNKIAKEINNHRNADNLSWPESKLMNQLEESNGKLSEFIPDTSNPSKRT